MAVYNKSEASQSFVFNAPAATVAEACQRALNQIGKVDEVIRETGTITGTMPSMNIWKYSSSIFLLKITKEGEATKVDVQVQMQADPKGDGSGKAIGKFAAALTSDTALKGASNSGW